MSQHTFMIQNMQTNMFPSRALSQKLKTHIFGGNNNNKLPRTNNTLHQSTHHPPIDNCKFNSALYFWNKNVASDYASSVGCSWLYCVFQLNVVREHNFLCSMFFFVLQLHFSFYCSLFFVNSEKFMLPFVMLYYVGWSIILNSLDYYNITKVH